MSSQWRPRHPCRSLFLLRAQTPTLRFYESTSPDIIQFGFSSNYIGTVDLVGTGTSVSYSGLEAANIAGLESLIGSTFALDGGSGFNPVQVAAVPEPSHALLCLTSIASLALRRA